MYLSEGNQLGSVPPSYLIYRVYVYFVSYFIFILKLLQNGLPGVVFQIKRLVAILISVFEFDHQFQT